MSANLAGFPTTRQESSASIALHEQLMLTLHDGACRFLEQGAAAMRTGDVGETHVTLCRGDAIVSHLQRTLEMDGREIASSLLTIYQFCQQQLKRARLERDPRKIDEVVRLLGQLRDARDTTYAR
jgi:flagellar biosynthetic protein FliS